MWSLIERYGQIGGRPYHIYGNRRLFRDFCTYTCNGTIGISADGRRKRNFPVCLRAAVITPEENVAALARFAFATFLSPHGDYRRSWFACRLCNFFPLIILSYNWRSWTNRNSPLEKDEVLTKSDSSQQAYHLTLCERALSSWKNYNHVSAGIFLYFLLKYRA